MINGQWDKYHLTPMGEEANLSLQGLWKEWAVQGLEAADKSVVSLHQISKSGGK